MNKKQISIISTAAVLLVAGTLLLSSFSNSKTTKTEYKTITTTETLAIMGFGSSRMIISDNKGSTEKDMQNFFSGLRINFKDISSNSVLINQTLGSLADDGWELEATTTSTQSASDDVQGFIITRYILVRETE